MIRLLTPAATLLMWAALASPAATAAAEPLPLTPLPPETPRINGAAVFGVRPGSPFLYTIPATGRRPMSFAADMLPAGLKLGVKTGQITGSLAIPGRYTVVLRARNELGEADRRFLIVVGDAICLTPPMGWNSWNHYGGRITEALVLENARAMASSGLINHGWTYINIDDSWQGSRGGPFLGIQGNEKFPDIKALSDAVHGLGLKLGIYSTPWEQSYAGYIGGSADNPHGAWARRLGKPLFNRKIRPWAIGRYSFAGNDVNQWAAWGIDYLKYDWNPNEAPETHEMAEALRRSGRNIVFSLSNNTPFAAIPALSAMANCWRIAGDIQADWPHMIAEALGDERWRPYARPGHWNDPDMLEIGTREKGRPGLTPDEEYTHMSFWCLLSAPLLLGNDLTAMSPFTLSLLTNDEVLALDQDPLGRQAWPVERKGATIVYAKPLADGSWAVGLFNLGNEMASVSVHWADFGQDGPRSVRDLWRQKDLGSYVDAFSGAVPAHGVLLIRIR